MARRGRSVEVGVGAIIMSVVLAVVRVLIPGLPLFAPPSSDQLSDGDDKRKKGEDKKKKGDDGKKAKKGK